MTISNNIPVTFFVGKETYILLLLQKKEGIKRQKHIDKDIHPQHFDNFIRITLQHANRNPSLKVVPKVHHE